MTETCKADTALFGDRIDGVQWVYHSSYYDGPLSGLVRLPDGREVWADCAQQCDCYDEEADRGSLCGFYRRYQLTTMTPERARQRAEQHADFREFVGTHTDYGRNEARVVHPIEQRSRFYDKWMGRSWTPDGEPVGWIEL